MDGTTTKEDVRIDKDDADELNREAAEDLERIENESEARGRAVRRGRRRRWQREGIRGGGGYGVRFRIAPKPRRKSCLSRPPAKPTKRSTKTIPLSERNYHG